MVTTSQRAQKVESGHVRSMDYGVTHLQFAQVSTIHTAHTDTHTHYTHYTCINTHTHTHLPAACTAIENCADIRCTNSSDQLCHECQSHTGEALGEAAYRNLLTECFREPLLITFSHPHTLSYSLSSLLMVARFLLPWQLQRWPLLM